MNQALLCAIGVGVFAITLVATLLYGFFAFGQMYEAAVVDETADVPLAVEIEADVARESAVAANSPRPATTSLPPSPPSPRTTTIPTPTR